MNLIPPSLPWSSYVLSSFGLYCNACFGILFVSILCACCSHFSWYCFISCTMSCAPVFPLMHCFFSLSSFVIPSKCLKNFICAASKHCSTIFFSTQASLPNFSDALAVMILFLNPFKKHSHWLMLWIQSQKNKYFGRDVTLSDSSVVSRQCPPHSDYIYIQCHGA